MINEGTAISVKGLCKSYKDKSVLKQTTFQVEQGTIFCLLGSNGAGKTTTVNILSTLLEADAGEVRLFGYDVKREGQEIRKRISLTGQYAAVDDILSGRENLMMVAKLSHIEHPKEKTNELLRWFQLEDAADRRSSTYSGGMRRRLDIAMSLVGNPSLIFLDEPTTGLDPQSRIAMWDMILDLKRQGVTIFLTTQYLEEAEQLADHVAMLHEGVIVAEGSVNEMKQLIKGEHMIFTFHTQEQLRIAETICADQILQKDTDNLQITLRMEGGIKEMTEILLNMEKHHITPDSFIQKKATLEDVFLHLIQMKGAYDA